MMPDALIMVENLVKHYTIAGQNQTILKQLSFAIKPGESVAIIGSSGSGKSTLMNILGLLDTPNSGTYRLNQQLINHLSTNELAALRNRYIGFVFRQFNLLSRFSAEQNISLPLTYRNLSAVSIAEQATQALARVGMTRYAQHKPTQLSGGQQQRIAIARALVGEPDVILADEPTGALDSRTGQEILDLFLHLNQEGRTLILVTHDPHVAACCARRITLADGLIVSDEYS